jgi:hypothetical protein
MDRHAIGSRAPCWNRDGTQILFPSIASDADKTRQLFLIQIKE